MNLTHSDLSGSVTFTVTDTKNENISTNLFNVNTRSFDSVAQVVESGNMLDILNYNIKRFVYDKLTELAESLSNNLQDKLIIGLYTSNDAVFIIWKELIQKHSKSIKAILMIFISLIMKNMSESKEIAI